jgi:hypothetical protein
MINTIRSLYHILHILYCRRAVGILTANVYIFIKRHFTANIEKGIRNLHLVQEDKTRRRSRLSMCGVNNVCSFVSKSRPIVPLASCPKTIKQRRIFFLFTV